MVQQFVAGLSQVDLLSELLEERHSGMLLELPYLGRDSGLRQMKLGRGARIARKACDRFEDLQLAQRRMLHFLWGGVRRPRDTADV
jgi:hypothetical protein